MSTYSAPKPVLNKSRRKFIATRVLFPPVLIWDLLKYGVNKLAGKPIGKLLLPVQGKASEYPLPQLSRLNSRLLTWEKHQITTWDGAVLDTLEAQPRWQANVPPECKKYIINFLNNGSFYEDPARLAEMREDAIELGCNVISFNYRGVGNSTSCLRSKDNLLTDGIAQVQRLLDNGVSPQNITLKGHSLGGAVASLVALHFHDTNRPVNIFNDRSFSSVSNLVVGWTRHFNLKTRIYSPEKAPATGQKILAVLAKPLIKLVLAVTNWEMDAGAAMRKIPGAYRDHLVIRTRREKRMPLLVDDAVIPHYASIHTALKVERKAKKKAVQQRDLEKSLANRDPLNPVEAEWPKVKEGFKARKLENDVYPPEDAHTWPRVLLHNRKGTNGKTLFREFFRAANVDHGINQPPCYTL